MHTVTKKVLLTGASGFIGRHTISSLIKRGYEVHAVFNTSDYQLHDEKGLFWHQCNLFDPEEQRQLLFEIKPTHLLHFAWYAVPGKYWTSLENIRCVQASLNLVIYFIENGGKRMVGAGTCAEYDWSYGYCKEGLTPARPSTLYGTCKHSLQEMIGCLSLQTGLSSAWGRIFFLYGPFEQQTRLVSYVISSLLKKETVRCSHGKQIRDYLYVKDVANAFVSLLETDISGPVNIASGAPIALRDVIYKIAEKLDSKHLIQLGAVTPPASEPHLLVADIDRLKNEVGWSPNYDLDEGLEETINWWRG